MSHYARMDGIIPAALFRYFAEREHAERFLAGELLFRPLSFYLDIEDEEVRGDKNEGRMTFSPQGGLPITKTDGTRVDGFTQLNAVVMEDEIFVLCLSDTRSDMKADRFGPHCVEVLDTTSFLQKAEAALPAGAEALFSRKVTYDDPRAPPGPRHAFPDLTVASKWPSFSWQDEHRLFFSTTNALAFQNFNYTISNHPLRRPKRTAPLPESVPVRVKGGIGDICRLL
jgi:hypothetical protein